MRFFVVQVRSLFFGGTFFFLKSQVFFVGLGSFFGSQFFFACGVFFFKEF